MSHLLSYLLLALALYAAAALDATLLVRARFAGATPQLMLLAGLCWICIYRGSKAWAGAALAGLAADVAGTGRLGICFASLAGLACLVDWLGSWLPLDRPAAQATLVAGGTAAIVFVVSGLGAIPEMADLRWSALLGWATVTGLYTGLVGWPVLSLLDQRRHARC